MRQHKKATRMVRRKFHFGMSLFTHQLQKVVLLGTEILDDRYLLFVLLDFKVAKDKSDVIMICLPL